MLENWNILFPSCQPIVYLMRQAFAERWVRFHSLPESQRYPTCDLEFQTLLNRHNEVISSLIGSGDEVIVLISTHSESATLPVAASHQSNDVLWKTVESTDDDYTSYLHIFAARHPWISGKLDALFRQTALDKMRNLMVCEPNCEWVFGPYDGGMDVFLKSSIERDALKSRFQHWLSAHKNGL